MFVIALIGTLVVLKVAHARYFKKHWDEQYGRSIEGCIKVKD